MVVEEKICQKEQEKILYPECRTGKKKLWWNWKVAAWPIEAKAQQGSAQTKALKDIAKEKGKQRKVRRTFKMLREVWLNIRIEKMDIHKGIMVKVLLDSGTTEMFIDRKMAARHGFKLQRLERPVVVRNIDGTNNSAGVITYQVEVNVYYKNHMERTRMDICNLGRTEVILGMPWL